MAAASDAELQSPAKKARTDAGDVDERESAVLYPAPAHAQSGAHVTSMEQYTKLWKESVNDPDTFWARMARENLFWFRDFTDTKAGSFETGDIRWFQGGQLNVSYQCIDRHLPARASQVAIIHEGDEPGAARTFTYQQVLEETCKVANTLLAWGVKKGDTVAVYLPMVPDLAFVMLACARIGAVHSVVFAGFSADSLRDRILDAGCKWLITADEGRRGGRSIPLKATCDEAVAQSPCVERVFVYQNTHSSLVRYGPKDLKMEDELPKARPYCAPVTLDSEDPLFLLYTSGSTGKPKGVLHTQAGYILYAMMTHKYVFDIREGDVYACVADCGWITGHSYIVYGPLANGATTLMFESTPTYPNPSRYWDVVAEHKVTQFYTAPTAVRALMRYGTDPLQGKDLSSLRVLGSVGEPINPEAWRWYHSNVGGGRCAIVDTYWQTETGGIIVTPLPGATPTKPGSATLPFFGVDLALMDKEGKEVTGNGVSGMVCVRAPWPSITRTVFGDHQRYLTTYMKPFPGMYFTGDGGYRDADGYLWVTGRVDDVLNVSGHRLGSAEIESVLVEHASVAEAAVIGFPHATKGEGICCYVTTVAGVAEDAALLSELRLQVRKGIGPFATPDYIVITPALPKTRSGKIMRRVLRKIASQESEALGDITTLADSTVVAALITKVDAVIAAKAAKAAKAGK